MTRLPDSSRRDGSHDGRRAPGRRADLRPSDRDREHTAERLREAAAEGRIDFAELDERLGAAYAARSYAALDVLTADLPAAGAAGPAPGRAAEPERAGRPTRLLVGIFGGFARRGGWTVPRSLTAVCLWGGGIVDMREARFPAGEARVRALAMWGGMKILVPEDAEVYADGVGLFGLFRRGATGPGAPGGPRITVRGLALFGAVTVKRDGGKRGGGKG
jgi:hypothetical protein